MRKKLCLQIIVLLYTAITRVIDVVETHLRYQEKGKALSNADVRRKHLRRAFCFRAFFCNCLKTCFTDVFYLKPHPEGCSRSGCWYYNRAVGHNVLSQTVKRLCNQAGVDGYFTNHSLRRTCATRLFQQGIDEQQIMSITGHRSSTAVRMYKQVSHEQEEKLSNLIQPVKKYKIDDKAEEGDKQGRRQTRKHNSSY